MLNTLIAISIGYAFGCFNSAYYYTKWFKRKNIFELGSGNGGARNIDRLYGFNAAALVFCLDVAKVLLALFIVARVTPAYPYLMGTTALFALLGHIFPAQLKFVGGKGVACLIGAGLYFLSFKVIAITLGLLGVLTVADYLLYRRKFMRAAFITMFAFPFIIYFDVSITVFCYLSLCLLIVLLMHIKKKYKFKQADTKQEFRQIAKLNYLTFVEEIPQHEHNQEGVLEDKFHYKNTYIICKYGKKVIGMVAVNMQRPFSLDEKVPNLDSYIPQGKILCEVRLLSIAKEHRKGKVLLGLINEVYKYASANNIDCVLISGTTREIKMYKHLGFVPFYNLVGKQDALYQPMYKLLNKEDLQWKK